MGSNRAPGGADEKAIDAGACGATGHASVVGSSEKNLVEARKAVVVVVQDEKLKLRFAARRGDKYGKSHVTAKREGE